MTEMLLRSLNEELKAGGMKWQSNIPQLWLGLFSNNQFCSEARADGQVSTNHRNTRVHFGRFYSVNTVSNRSGFYAIGHSCETCKLMSALQLKIKVVTLGLPTRWLGKDALDSVTPSHFFGGNVHSKETFVTLTVRA